MNAPTTKRREIYACVAVQLRTHDRATKAESLCPGAMGMYLYLLLQARGEETAGDVLEANALASWGAPIAYRRKQLAALIDAGLVASFAGGRVLVVKYEEHNDGPGAIEANRAAARERKGRSRQGHVTRDLTVTDGVTAPPCHAQVPSSSSSSISGSDLESRSEDPPRSSREESPPANDNAPPAWWDAACDTVAASVAPVDDRGARWLEYSAARERKGWQRGQGDAVGWLSQVVRRERRDAKVAPMRGPGGGPRGDRQGLGGWKPPASTGTDDPFGGDS